MSNIQYITGFATLENPLDIDSFVAKGGFSGLHSALAMTPAEVISEVKRSGLRGRGGAGFPTGLKWESVAGDDERYLVCNADEGEPGTFKDRFVLEHAPFLVLEGMAIAAYATGAQTGYVYVRGEYPHVVASLSSAIASAVKAGYLGEHILGSNFSFNVEVRKGGGSYVVGAETALLNSLMGTRG
jgi:NADH:ubiquinone oxidoreductase subunit F (NADH-binding)